MPALKPTKSVTDSLIAERFISYLPLIYGAAPLVHIIGIELTNKGLGSNYWVSW